MFLNMEVLDIVEKKVVDSNPELRAKFEKAVNLVLMEEDKKHEGGRK